MAVGRFALTSNKNAAFCVLGGSICPISPFAVTGESQRDFSPITVMMHGTSHVQGDLGFGGHRLLNWLGY
jgi:hypothetical protein